ncbi:MAG: polysaccharide deacetylase family protein [Treponemataceae bacterium]
MKRIALKTVVLFALLIAAFSVEARTVFDGLDIGEDDRIMFRATAGGDGSPRQNAVFLADIVSGAVTQLTAFPERLELVDGGRTLQARNPFGVVRMSMSGGLPAPVKGFPSFSSGAVVLSGRPEDIAASPDGKWILYVEPITPAFGRLVLIDASTGSRLPIAEGVERPGRLFPASWSPDSRVFVYSRDRRLYSRSVDSTPVSLVDERYRLVGEGTVASIRWGAAGDFFYLRGSTVYRVRGSDLFARSLYSDFLEIGTVAGKIPFEFDPNFDVFWTSPDGSSIILAKGGRNIFYYPLGVDDYGASGAASLPYLMLPRSCSNLQALWSQSGIVTLFASFPTGSEQASRVYRLSSPSDTPALGGWGFSEVAAPSDSQAVLSPDGTKAVVYGPSGALIYDYVNWRVITKLADRHTFAALWIGNEELVLADSARIERKTLDGKSVLVCLSSADAYGYDDAGKTVLAKAGDKWFSTDGKSAWKVIAPVTPRVASTSSQRHRAYLERLPSGPYETMPMISDVKGVGTRSLFLKPPVEDDSKAVAAVKAEPIQNDAPFNHGNRYGRRELSVTFDLMEDAEGLPFVLDTLHRFGIKGTFFLNGEFIRRHPSAAKEIVVAGHETGSLFFAPIDLADSRYRIDADFIRRGLARNEDEFFNATGAELALSWHAPYYAVSQPIVASGASVGYRYVGRDIDPLDWFSRSDARKNPGLYRSAAEIVDVVMESKKVGSIIPIRLGMTVSGRDDYFFSKLDVLLDALMRSGYDVVPVSVLADHAR